jgi:hypothetical protein
MEIVIALALLAMALAYALAPVVRGARSEVEMTSVAVEEATARKHAALGALVDVENERAIGKLSGADFVALRDEYERQALDALRELDVLGAQSLEDDELEAEIAEMRARMTCPHCGALRTPGEACTKCGRES